VIRRPLWFAAGAALGAGGTVWTRRRLERLAQRVRPTAVAEDVAAMVERTRRGATTRLHDAVAAGRSGARRREDDLRRHLAPPSGPLGPGRRARPVPGAPARRALPVGGATPVAPR